MTCNSINESIVALSENSEFIEKIRLAESKENIQHIFSENGVELSREEVDIFIKAVENTPKKKDLSENELEQVYGGVTSWAIFTLVWTIGSKIVVPIWNAGKKFADWEARY